MDVVKKRMLCLVDVPEKFFKDEPFDVPFDALNIFLADLYAYVEGNVVTIAWFDTVETLRRHCGDARLWGSEGYTKLDKGVTQMIMRCNDYCEDIYEYMEENNPELYKLHMDYDESYSERT